MSERKITAAAIQMSSTPDKEENKATAEALTPTFRSYKWAHSEFFCSFL